MAGQFVDISHFNPTNIDWQAYKAWSAAGDGISRISLRTSYGTGNRDDHFLAYHAAALAAGIDVIIFYHYAYPQYNAAIDEANYQYSVVGAIRPNDVIMLDYEEAVPQATTQWALDFLAQQTKNYNGKLPTIYASSNYIKTRLQDNRLAVYPLTLANWTYDPNARPACPSPWSSYSYLQYSDKAIVPGIPAPVDADVFLGGTPQGGPVKLDSNGCVVTTRLWYQLSEGEQHTCGPTAVAALDNSVLPGTPLSASAETIDQETDDIILNVFGISDPKNFGGVLPIDMYHILIYIRDKYKRIHFKVVSSIDQIDRAIKAGYPCIISCNEMTEYAWDKNKQQWVHPYPWQIAGGHVFPVTGIEPGTGNWICPDQLNNNFQGYWPVIYDRSRIASSFSWGCIVKLPFLADIPDLNNWPMNFNAQITTGGVTVGLPTGAKDDGTTIHFANTPLVIAKGYRTIYNQLAASNQIPPDDQPLTNEYGANPVEFSNPDYWGGPGTAQETRYFRFGWSPKAGSKRLYFGQEFRTYMDMLVAAQAERDDLKKQIAALQAQLAASTGGTGIPQVVKDDITNLTKLIIPVASGVSQLMRDAGIGLSPTALQEEEKQ